ncbi:Stromal interaction molecule 1, partial [Stegodyphus mimosarum]
MDVVLFGVPKYRNYFKDVILVLSLVIAVGGCWFAYVQHKHSQTHMQKMMQDMDALQKAEDSLRDLQKELNKARQEQEIVSIEKQDLERRLQDEITTAKKYNVNVANDGTDSGDVVKLIELEKQLKVARSDLREAEKKLEARHWVAPPSLQHWLQLTHELELRNYNAKKAVAEQQLQAAKEGCEKLSKKRATFMGAFRIAHGSSIDDVDDRIMKAKSALYEVTTDLQERMHRWKQIELLCGFPIIMNPGIACLESILKPGLVNGTTGSSHPALNTLSQSNSDTTLREESPPPYAGLVPSAVSNIPPPSYSKSSPSFLRKNIEIPSYATSRVVYPRECYRPSDNVSSFETDNEDFQIAEIDDDSTERSVTPPSLASLPETGRAVFTVADGTIAEGSLSKGKDNVSMSSMQLSTEHSNGKMGDIVRKISAGLLEKKKKPASSIVEALKKSSSSSNIIDNTEGAVSSESSSSVITEDKHKKKKFFPHLRNRKAKS